MSLLTTYYYYLLLLLLNESTMSLLTTAYYHRHLSKIPLMELPVEQTLSDPLALHQSPPSLRRLVISDKFKTNILVP